MCCFGSSWIDKGVNGRRNRGVGEGSGGGKEEEFSYCGIWRNECGFELGERIELEVVCWVWNVFEFEFRNCWCDALRREDFKVSGERVDW